jgi:hypothetical protein
MKRFINHVDHVAWISRLETLEANLAELERLSDAKLIRSERTDLGYIICVNWAAGLEILAPLDRRTEANQFMHDWLETRGEGVIFVTFGVDDLNRHKARLAALGIEAGPLFEDPVDSPWHHQIELRERIAGTVMNSTFVLGDIAYQDGLISFGDA